MNSSKRIISINSDKNLNELRVRHFVQKIEPTSTCQSVLWVDTLNFGASEAIPHSSINVKVASPTTDQWDCVSTCNWRY